jgi:non-ribosomal peptide synthetase component F
VLRRALGPIAAGRVLQFASIGFDASMWGIIMALSAGGTLACAPDNTTEPGDLVSLLREQNITVATLPPSLLACRCRESCHRV